MLIQLTPDQIGEHWDRISGAIVAANPEASPFYVGRCLERMMSGGMQSWIVMRDNTLKGILVTGFMVDPAGVRILLVVALEGKDLMKNDYLEGLETLKKFAKGYDCYSISAFTTVPGIADKFVSVGFDEKQEYVSLRV